MMRERERERAVPKWIKENLYLLHDFKHLAWNFGCHGRWLSSFSYLVLFYVRIGVVLLCSNMPVCQMPSQQNFHVHIKNHWKFITLKKCPVCGIATLKNVLYVKSGKKKQSHITNTDDGIWIYSKCFRCCYCYCYCFRCCRACLDTEENSTPKLYQKGKIPGKINDDKKSPGK